MNMHDSAILFDMDGVLIDSTQLHYELWLRYARSRDFEPSASQLLETNGSPAAATIRRWWGHTDDALVETMRKEREALFEQHLEISTVTPVRGAHAFVAALKRAGIPRAVATSADAPSAQRVLSALGLARSFDTVVTSNDVRRGKPDPECWLTAAARLGVEPRRCIVIEDSLHGIRAAKAAGMRCLALETSFPAGVLEAESPDWIARDLVDVPPALRLWGALAVAIDLPT